MIIDAENQFSDSQALTATAVSTNKIDLESDRNIGIGEPMEVVITIKVAADVADADETYKFDLETDDNEGFSSATVVASRTIAGAALLAGTQHQIAIPADKATERFLQMKYTLGGTTPSVTVSADLVPKSHVQNDVAYPTDLPIQG